MAGKCAIVANGSSLFARVISLIVRADPGKVVRKAHRPLRTGLTSSSKVRRFPVGQVSPIHGGTKRGPSLLSSRFDASCVRYLERNAHYRALALGLNVLDEFGGVVTLTRNDKDLWGSLADAGLQPSLLTLVSFLHVLERIKQFMVAKRPRGLLESVQGDETFIHEKP
jgi:hypothetical protein